MITQETFTFLSELAENNNKEWFDENRKRYQSIRKDFIQFIESVIQKISLFDKKIASVDPKKTIFRINRDIRFSKDKSPYKNNFGAFMVPGGKNSGNPGYYIHLEPNQCFIGSGVYMPPPPILQKVRQEVDYNLEEFKNIVSNSTFSKVFGNLYDKDKLKNPPRGYQKDNPAIEYLKLKSYIVSKQLSNNDFLSKDAEEIIVDYFKLSYPLVQFIYQALDD